MVKIQCVVLNQGTIDNNTYSTPKGNTYMFFKKGWTDINDIDDIDYFLKAGNGMFFITKEQYDNEIKKNIMVKEIKTESTNIKTEEKQTKIKLKKQTK